MSLRDDIEFEIDHAFATTDISHHADNIVAAIRKALTSDEAVESAVRRTFSAEWAEGEDIPALRQARIEEYRAGITASLDAVIGEEKP